MSSVEVASGLGVWRKRVRGGLETPAGARCTRIAAARLREKAPVRVGSRAGGWDFGKNLERQASGGGGGGRAEAEACKVFWAVAWSLLPRGRFTDYKSLESSVKASPGELRRFVWRGRRAVGLEVHQKKCRVRQRVPRAR